MKLRSALLAATVLAAPVAAKAEAVSGVYIGAGAGINIMQDQYIKSVAFPQLGVGAQTSQRARVEMNPGFAGVASVGYGLGNGLRLELEGDYRQNKFVKASSVNGTSRAGGDELKYGGMFNVLYDFDASLLSGLGAGSISPYVGLGAGYMWDQHQNNRFSATTGPLVGAPFGVSSTLRTNSGKGAFAYQGIVGVAFPIGSVPGLALTLDYRFMGLATNRSYNYQYFRSGVGTPSLSTGARLKFEDDYNHTIMFGVRYAFGAAPAPVPVAVAPPARNEVARTYLVFFDWDRADLTTRARAIINEAAQATTRIAVTRIEVAGHTDRSGTVRYNQGLSQRRAANVAAELVRLGVPRAAITTQAFGESRPLVQTADGVREPQNRRVEIVLR